MGYKYAVIGHRHTLLRGAATPRQHMPAREHAAAAMHHKVIPPEILRKILTGGKIYA